MSLHTKKKLLVIPSWYPVPSDKINGSFFQEQSKLLIDTFDIRVLFFKFVRRPSLRVKFGKILSTFSSLFKYFFADKERIILPDEEVFQQPPLILYSTSVFSLTKRGEILKKIDAYVSTLSQMVAEGWVPDLVHAHSVNLAGLVAHRIKEIYGIPYVITEHMPFALSNYPEYIRKDIKISFMQADIVLSLSYDKVRQLGLSGIDVEPNLIYNFVDETVFKNVCNKYCPGDQLKLISIGAASPLKDYFTLLRALVALRDKGIPFKLTLIGLKIWGDKDVYDGIIRFIKEHALDDSVNIIEKVNRLEVSEHLRANSVFLLTSIAEGFPVSVLEAMASGLFVIATRHGGTEDILTKDTGVIVQIKDYMRICETLEDIYRGKIQFDPNIIRDYIVALCGTAAFTQRITNFYNQVLNRNA